MQDCGGLEAILDTDAELVHTQITEAGDKYVVYVVQAIGSAHLQHRRAECGSKAMPVITKLEKCAFRFGRTEFDTP